MRLLTVFLALLALEIAASGLLREFIELTHLYGETIASQTDFNQLATYVETVKETKRLYAALPKIDRYKPYYWPIEVSYAYQEGYQM